MQPDLSLRAAIAALLLTPLAAADVVSGRVVDALGQPVPGVNIDIDNLGSGGDPVITNDFTDANGLFSIVVPAGFYDVSFFPPAPPATTHLVTVEENVTVVGTNNLGDVTLPAGHALSGRVLGIGGAPVVGLDIDVIEESSGDKLDTPNDFTDALGNFHIAVPTDACRVRFDGDSGLGALLVSKEFEFDLSGDFAMGDVQLVAGFVLGGRLLNGAVGVPNADVDVYDATGAKVFTANDDTNALGNFSVVVPAGALTVEICPLFSSPVAGVLRQPTVVGSTNLGNIVAPPAVTLSGVLTDHFGAPMNTGDVDLYDAVTGASVFVCYDDVKPGGTYALRAPLGTYDVVFEPVDFSQPLGADAHENYVLSTNQVLNGVLPNCPFPTTYGVGQMGAGGFVPTMGSQGGAPRVQNGDFALTVSNVVGGTFGYVFIGFAPANIPFGNATALIDPFGPIYQFSVFANGAPGVPGAGTAVLALPVQPSYAGIAIYAQSVLVDASLAEFLVLSNAVTVQFCR